MAFTPTSSERQQAHRFGQSTPMQKRRANAEMQNAMDAGEFNVVRSALPTVAGAALTSGTAYWVYVGRTSRPVTCQNVFGHVTTGGSGTQTAEIAIATGSAPSRAAQALTVVSVTANGALDDLTGTGVKGITSALGYVPDVGAHLWLGIRTAMGTTQPTFFGLTFDCSNGEILTTASAGVLAVGSSYTGALITAAVTFQAPALQLSFV
jgi:hypothetical protein